MPYHTQIVLVHERPFTDTAVGFVVAHGLHVVVCCHLRVELYGARLARDGRRPMPQTVHVLTRCMLRPESFRARLAFIDWGSVAQSIHVLVAGGPTVEGTRTSLTFQPMAIVVHMLPAVVLVVEVVVTGRAFVAHLGCTRGKIRSPS